MTLFRRFCINSLEAKDVDPAINYMNYMVDRMELNEEQILWLCFLFGVTYHLPSAYLIWNEYPDLELVDIERLSSWWLIKQKHIPFQQDKMKQRKDFVSTVHSYKALVGDNQKRYFDTLLTGTASDNFKALWGLSSTDIKYFGRFSIWNWCQALKHVAGYNINPNKLMVGEKSSVSFTDGLAYAFGHPEKATVKVKVNGKTVKQVYSWSQPEKDEMERKCAQLKFSLGIDNFELETLACAYKKIWRTHESRYVGYYNDRIADDIKSVETYWSGVDWKLLWDARIHCVPKKYIHNSGVDKSKFLLSPKEKIMM